MYNTDPISFNSIIKDLPARKIPENILHSGENIVFDNGVIKTRNGIALLSDTPLNGAVSSISLYKKLRVTDRHIIAFTPTDIYVYNSTTGKFDLKTRNYSTGTVNCTTYHTTPDYAIKYTLTGGTWSTDWDKQNTYEISFDSATMDDCTTWYKVVEIESSSVLEVESGTVPIVSNSVYCLRLCYSGAEDDFWHCAYPYSDTASDRIIVATNGIDRVQYWDGTGYFDDMSQYTDTVKFLAFFGSVGYEHLILANYYDKGSSVNFPQTMQWFDAGGDLVFSGNYAELIDNDDPILGIVPLGDRLLIYKSGTISIAIPNPNGGNIDAFIIQQNVVNFGTPSINTVVNVGEYHIIFTGIDIRTFDGHSFNIISEGNNKFIIDNINKEYQHRSFSFVLPEQSLYCFCFPARPSEYCNTMMVYNYRTNSWTYWSMSDRNGDGLYLLSKGKGFRAYAPSWETLKGTGILANEMSHRWFDLKEDDRYTIMFMGDRYGYIYTYAVDFDADCDTDISSTFSTKDFDLNKAGFDFRLLECVLMLQLKDDYSPATIDVRASVDFGKNWSSWITLPLDGNSTYMEKKVNFNMLGKQVRFEIKMSNPLIFESMTIGFNADYKSMKFDN